LAALAVAVALLVLPLGWWRPDAAHGHDRGPAPTAAPATATARGLTYAALQALLLATPSPARARAWSAYYTAGAHLAGQNRSQAAWTRDRWREFGVPAEVGEYAVYLNYPVGHRLALLEAVRGAAREREEEEEGEGEGEGGEGTKPKSTYAVRYECGLEEDVLAADPTTSLPDRVPTFHGYSASGNVTARYVYVNFGTVHDFAALARANVSLAGHIAVAKYGRIFRGLKVKRAQELGMLGVVLYSDPQEDGDVTEANGFLPYPDGPARNPSAVQRGSVEFICEPSRAYVFCLAAWIRDGFAIAPCWMDDR
jgi:N-acetylated-alpha-linked acidic dipeptidase